MEHQLVLCAEKPRRVDALAQIVACLAIELDLHPCDVFFFPPIIHGAFGTVANFPRS
jgi:hypothetical protein